MSSNAEAIIRINHAGLSQIHQAVLEGVAEVFAQDMWPAAAKGSPVETGHNRRTIAVEVSGFGEKKVATSGDGETSGVTEVAETGVTAAIYTQSGYGGYLETGHVARHDQSRRSAKTGRFRRVFIGPDRFVPARPYIYPAVQKFMGTIGAAVKRHFEAISKTVTPSGKPN